MIAPLTPQVNTGDVDVSIKQAVYLVPKRSMRMSVVLENHTDSAVQIGEFSVANVRFINPELVSVNPQESADLVAKQGLRIADNTPIQPGATKTLSIEVQDAAWETEKLNGLIRDSDSRMGGLMFLYGADGNRFIVSLSAPVIPQFVNTP